MLTELGVAHQFGKTALPAGQLRFVARLVELLVQIECREHIQTVDLGSHRRSNRETLVAVIGQALLQCVEHDAPNGERTVAVVCALNDNPRRPGRIGHAQDMAGSLLELVICLQPFPAFLGHPPRRARVFLHRLEAFLLRIF